MRRSMIVAMVALGSLALFRCAAGGDTPTKPAAPESRLTTSSLVDELRRAGLAVQDAGTVRQPFFSVPARVYQVDGRDLQVYEFATEADAESAASEVAPAGSPIGTTMVTWMAAPHFFRKERLLVNYIGTSDKVLSELQRLLGPQFAGR